MDKSRVPAPGTWYNNKSISRKKRGGGGGNKQHNPNEENQSLVPREPSHLPTDNGESRNATSALIIVDVDRTSTSSHLATGVCEKLYSDWPILVFALYWILFTFPYIQLVRALIGYRPINLGTLYEVTDATASFRRVRHCSSGTHRSLRTQFDLTSESQKKVKKVGKIKNIKIILFQSLILIFKYT